MVALVTACGTLKAALVIATNGVPNPADTTNKTVFAVFVLTLTPKPGGTLPTVRPGPFRSFPA